MGKILVSLIVCVALLAGILWLGNSSIPEFLSDIGLDLNIFIELSESTKLKLTNSPYLKSKDPFLYLCPFSLTKVENKKDLKKIQIVKGAKVEGNYIYVYKDLNLSTPSEYLPKARIPYCRYWLSIVEKHNLKVNFEDIKTCIQVLGKGLLEPEIKER